MKEIVVNSLGREAVGHLQSGVEAPVVGEQVEIVRKNHRQRYRESRRRAFKFSNAFCVVEERWNRQP